MQSLKRLKAKGSCRVTGLATEREEPRRQGETEPPGAQPGHLEEREALPGRGPREGAPTWRGSRARPSRPSKRCDSARTHLQTAAPGPYNSITGLCG